MIPPIPFVGSWSFSLSRFQPCFLIHISSALPNDIFIFSEVYCRSPVFLSFASGLNHQMGMSFFLPLFPLGSVLFFFQFFDTASTKNCSLVHGIFCQGILEFLVHLKFFFPRSPHFRSVCFTSLFQSLPSP